MAYQVEGHLLEACTCNVMCPCWLGQDPDGGLCEGMLAWHVDKGNIDGIDVSGRTIACIARIPGNILKGNWTARLYVDDKATPQQRDALLGVWSGKKGGAMADLAKLIGKVESVEQVPISLQIEGVKGSIRIGSALEASVEPVTDGQGHPTTVHDSVFSTIPGAPAYIGKASSLRVKAPGFDVDIKGHSAVSTTFRFAA
jgi:hypothetical protein